MLVPTIRTPVSLLDFTRAAIRQWGNGVPSEKAMALLMGQFRVETGGMGENTFNWNVGNHKYNESGNYMVLTGVCEPVAPGDVDKLVAEGAIKTPAESKCRGQVAPKGMVMVEWIPPHPVTRFQAFSSLDEGMAYHLNRFKKKFTKAWGTIQEEGSSPEDLAKALAAQRYFTADPSAYARLLRTGYDAYLRSGVYAQALSSLGTVPPSPPGSPGSSPGSSFPWGKTLACVAGLGAVYLVLKKTNNLPESFDPSRLTRYLRQ